MKLLLTSVISLLTSYISFAQLPDCDIWLLDIKDSAGQVSFHNPVNITNRKGYDNQPAFSIDSKYILYSSQKDSGGPTDIYQYRIKGETTKIFNTTYQLTKNSKYSPTFMPGGLYVSAVVVEKDSTQRLWSYDLYPIGRSLPQDKQSIELRHPNLLMENVKEIGYHCWINKDSVALYILTKPAFTLQIVNIHTQKKTVIADSIGRCMRMRNGNLWYTTKAGHFWNVYEYSFKSKTSFIKGMIESEDFCFFGKHEIWSLSDNTIITGFMNSKLGASEILNTEVFGITKPTRITISPDGKKLAVVSNK